MGVAGRAAQSAKRMEQYRDERDRILQAAFTLIGRDATPRTTSVAEILREAGLSTRAFYRHFSSKYELIFAMYISAADRLGDELSAAVAAAPGPPEALEAWIRGYLAVVFDPRRARQTDALSTMEFRTAPNFDAVRQEQTGIHRTMLAEVIRSGKRLGAFPGATDPEEDARAVLSVINGLVDARLAGAHTPTWAEATTHTTRLFLRAFGYPDPE